MRNVHSFVKPHIFHWITWPSHGRFNCFHTRLRVAHSATDAAACAFHIEPMTCAWSTERLRRPTVCVCVYMSLSSPSREMSHTGYVSNFDTVYVNKQLYRFTTGDNTMSLPTKQNTLFDNTNSDSNVVSS